MKKNFEKFKQKKNKTEHYDKPHKRGITRKENSEDIDYQRLYNQGFSIADIEEDYGDSF